MRLDRTEIEDVLYRLELTRRAEEALTELHERQSLSSPLSLSRGLEALGVGAASALEASDSLASSLPTIGPWLARGVSVASLFDQLLGCPTSSGAGHDGLRHFGDSQKGVVATSGHLATHVGVLAGVAFAHRVRGEGDVALALLPSSALATGDFHEGFNFAVVQRCALVVVVAHDESNAPASYDLAQIAQGYGAPSVAVDGRDVLEVLQVVATAVSRARSGHGPALIDAAVGPCGRYRGFVDAVPAPLTTGGGLASPAVPVDVDPVQRFQDALASNAWIAESVRDAATSRAAREVSSAVERAASASDPGAGSQAPQGQVFAT